MGSRFPCLVLWISVVACAPAPPGDWPSYGSDKASSKYSPLDQIVPTNVERLQVAWRWESPDTPILEANPRLYTWLYEATPILVDGVLYTSTSLSQAAAIDPSTGETRWVYDPETYREGWPPNNGFVHRGVTYWNDGDDRRILYGTGDGYLIALDAETGAPVPEFGRNGRIDLTKGLAVEIDRPHYGVTSPPIVCRDVIVVGASILDFPAKETMPPGHVRGFDVRTGEDRWSFHSIPRDGENGIETWEGGSWKNAGHTNVWTMMSCDEELGIIYLPFGTSTNDYYGGRRPGNNLYGESLVALRAETGEKLWHFQTVHHGLWDYDLPAAPNLVDITVEGRRVRAVAQVSKQAFCYVFDRVSGEPVWPIEERPVPGSNVLGEKPSPTQPFPTRPAPFDRQGIGEDDLIDWTPELRQWALEESKDYVRGALFTPPSEQGTLTLPGPLGGASWAGAAADPKRGILYVSSITGPAVLSVTDSHPLPTPHRFVGTRPFDLAGRPVESPAPDSLFSKGIPFLKPPYGRVTAIDLNSGEHLWMMPVGEGPRNHPLLRGLDLPTLGWPRRSLLLLTPSILFVAQEGKKRIRGLSPLNNAIEAETEIHRPSLRALDPRTGATIAEVALPGNATGSPMTYSYGGKQFIVIPIGGASQPAELVALSLQ